MSILSVFDLKKAVDDEEQEITPVVDCTDGAVTLGGSLMNNNQLNYSLLDIQFLSNVASCLVPVLLPI